MTKTIVTYEELMLEKNRLQVLLKVQKELVREDINEIKQELAPVKSVISFAGKLVSKEPGNFLLNATSNTIIDLVVKKLLLSRSGWLTKIAVPFLLKNYTSHVIDDNKDTILRKIFSLFKRKDKAGSNGELHHTEETEED
jgi:hypothetical protein